MATLVLLLALLLVFVLIGGPAAVFWKRRRSFILRCLAIAYPCAALALLFGFAPYWIARMIASAGTRPPDRLLTENPVSYRLEYEDVWFDTEDAIRLSGWLVAPSARNAVIIATHGLFRNRVELLARMAPLCHSGYGALLYDSRSHGASGKGIVSFGYYEKQDVLAAIRYVRRALGGAADQPAVVLMGVSMGAVATLEAAAVSDEYSALILDSPFSDLRRTVADHTRLFVGLPRFPFADLFLFWYGRAAGFDPDLLDSRTALHKVRPVPLLVIASEGDERIPADVARALFAESAAPLKRLKVFGSDVPHGAAARLHPQEYSATLAEFLAEALH
jgi:dipeptidyl aminopeptidase/acylaminoacyl peptidase